MDPNIIELAVIMTRKVYVISDKTIDYTDVCDHFLTPNFERSLCAVLIRFMSRSRH